jgi:hypothetical protein
MADKNVLLESAAVASRLPFDKMTREEANLFHEIFDEGLSKAQHIEKYKMFIFIRNKIVINFDNIC